MFNIFSSFKFRKLLERSFNKLSERDLSIDLSSNDSELKKNKLFRPFFHFLSSFTFILRLISRSSSNVNKNMKEVVVFSEKLKNQSENVFNAISSFQDSISRLAGETHNTIAEFHLTSSNLQNLVEKNDSILHSSDDIQKKIKEGQKGMSNTVFIISELVDQNKDLKTSIHDLWKQFGVISNVVRDLMKILENARMLALNAEIEAAHAGEAGKGFSIVAQEMGKLAEKSNSISYKILQGINSIRENAKMTEINVDSSVEFATEMQVQITQAEGLYNRINSASENVLKDSKEFHNSMEELEQDFKITAYLIADTERVLSDSIVKTGEIKNDIESQWKDMESINERAASTFRVSRVLNALVSLFSVPGFKNVSMKQQIAEGILERALNIRGIAVSLIFAKEDSVSKSVVAELTDTIAEMDSFLKKTIASISDKQGLETINSFNSEWITYLNILNKSLGHYKNGEYSKAREVYDTEGGKKVIKVLVDHILLWMTGELLD